MLKITYPSCQIKYEPLIQIENKIYIPDFCVYDKGDLIKIIEVSGYGSFNEKGRKRNSDKIIAFANFYKTVEIDFIVAKQFLKYYNFTTFNNVKLYEYKIHKP
jgi:hypothetical protein